MMKEIKALLKINKSGITVHGWVSKKELSIFWGKAEFWLYPCIFEETFCLTALEAAISKTCVITNGLAALGETATYGTIISGNNPITKEWQQECLIKLFECMKNKPDLEQNYLFAKSLTWEKQAIKFLDFLV